MLFLLNIWRSRSLKMYDWSHPGSMNWSCMITTSRPVSSSLSCLASIREYSFVVAQKSRWEGKLKSTFTSFWAPIYWEKDILDFLPLIGPWVSVFDPHVLGASAKLKSSNSPNSAIVFRTKLISLLQFSIFSQVLSW